MKIKKKAFYIDLHLSFILKVILLGTFKFISIYLFFGIYKDQKTYSTIIKEKSKSENIINEIRQNSEDLTRLARLYTDTKDTLYRNQYFEVLNINIGNSPRPLYFNRAYWSILTTRDHQEPPFIKSIKKSSSNLIMDADFAAEEKLSIIKAFAYSLSLTNFEIKAFATLEGLNNEKNTIDGVPNQIKAMEMVNSEYYHRQVILIMKELNKAYNLLEIRTNRDLNNLQSKISNRIILLSIIFVIIILNLLLIIYSSINLKKETINQLKISVETKTKELNESVILNKKIAHDLSELNASKDLFFSIIAHDLKGPFNSLIGFSNLLVDQIKIREYEESLESVEIIKTISKNTLDLLQDLLLWAQMQKGDLQFKRENVRILDVINDVLKVESFQSMYKKIEIKTIMSNNNLMAYVDKNMLSIILRNLISNAIKYSYLNGKIEIKCSVEANDIKICVSDIGIGIPKERFKRLFNYEHHHKTLGTIGEKGTGLGLILSENFVKKHNGIIWVESEIGKGSSFIFTLPILNNF